MFFPKEILLFFGMIVGGETILIPAMYLVLHGSIAFLPFVAIVIAATALSDSIWFYIGRSIPKKRIATFPLLKKYAPKIDNAQALLTTYKEAGIILSKFVYGTRILVQVLAGSIRMSFFKYLAINTCGIFLYLFFILGIGTLLYTVFSYTHLEGILQGIMVITSLAVISTLIIWQTTRYIQKKSQ